MNETRELNPADMAGEQSLSEQPVRKRKGLTGPAIMPRVEIGPDGTVRTIRTRKDAEELGEEYKEQSRENRGGRAD